MKTIKWALLSTGAVILLILYSPVVFLIQVLYRIVSKKYDLWYYFNAIAVGVDALGGSLIYGSKRHTISAITGYKAYLKSKWHIRQAKLIDKMFKNNHCYNAAVSENLIKGLKK
jgi:hypothetical protein